MDNNLLPKGFLNVTWGTYKSFGVRILCFSKNCILFYDSDLKIPIRVSAGGFSDVEDGAKPTKSDLSGAKKGPCCTCQKTAEEKDREKDDRVFIKMFENYLHNIVFYARYG